MTLPLKILIALLFATGSQNPTDRGQQAQSAAETAVRHHQAGELQEAVASYEEALQLGLEHPLLLTNLGAAYAGLGEYGKAVETYNRAVILFGENPALRTNLGLAYYKQADTLNALQQFQRALELEPTNVQAASLLADCHFRMGRYNEVIRILNPFKDQAGGNAGIAYLLGTALIREGRPEEGQIYVDMVLRKGDSPEAHLMLAVVHRLVGDIPAAISEVEKAIQLNPQLPGCNGLLGQMLFSGDSVDRLARFSTGLRQAQLPENPDRVADAFRKELKINPIDFESNFYLGYLLLLQGEYEQSFPYLEKARSLRPEAFFVAYHLATSYQYAGQLDRARVLLEELVTHLPDVAEIHSSLAMIYYRQQNQEAGDRHRDIVVQLKQEEQARQKELEQAESRGPAAEPLP